MGKIDGLVRCCLPISQKLHDATKRLDHQRGRTVHSSRLSGFLLDCTEQPMPKSMNRLRRRLYYSYGKRKKHTHGKEPVHRRSEGDDNQQIRHRQTKR
jgi:hypothetical protein